jgi:hypothetical protein
MLMCNGERGKKESRSLHTARVSKERLSLPCVVHDSTQLDPLLLCHEHTRPQQVQNVLHGSVLVCKAGVT